MAIDFFPGDKEDTDRANQIIDIAAQMKTQHIGVLIQILFSFVVASTTLEAKCKKQAGNTHSNVKH